VRALNLKGAWVHGAPIDATITARDWEQRQIARAVSGDAEAIRAIIQQHYRGMYALALRRVRNRTEAEDIVQESLARAFIRLDQFDWTYRLSTWLYRIVLNCCRDHLKSPRRLELPAGLRYTDACVAPSEPERDPCVVRERSATLLDAVAKLRPKYSEIIVLKDLLEFSYQEIHDLTGTPVTGLKIRAIRARECLRNLLKEDAE
jgi:RNA polymerase sigma-70 factor (ECF subfamily)